MATGAQVLKMLLPNAEWSIAGDSYEAIDFYGGVSITKKEFEDGFATADAFLAKKEADKVAAKQVILEKLGLTAEEVTTLLA
jgi:hypothetical protein